MKWPAYPKYKDSGVDWLGEVPEEWALQKLKTVSTLTGGGTPSKDNLNYWTNGQILWVSPKDMTSQIIIDAEDSITEQAVRESTTNYIEEGMPLLVVRSGILKHTIPVAIAGCRLTINQDMKAFSFDNIITPRFFTFWVEGNNDALLFAWRQLGATVESIDIPAMQKTLFPIPQKDEQKSIVAYLEIEIGKIDSLIAEQEKLITLLQEKRQAVISHAVTKGLNPDAPMKDSGVEWLGKIPGKWDVVKFKYCAYIAEGLVDPTEKHQGDKILIAPDHVEKGTGRILMLETAEQQGAISNKYTVSPGQIIYSKIRPALNKLCIARGDWLCSADMYPLTPSDNCASDFMLYYMLSPVFVSYAQLISDRVAMPKINREQLSIVCVPIPPLTEQRIIVKYLDAETERIDVLIAEAQRTTELLYERRTALISAAVTGKIDVRGLTASEPA